MTMDRLQPMLINILITLGIIYILFQFYIFFDKRRSEKDLAIMNIMKEIYSLKYANTPFISDIKSVERNTISQYQTEFFNKSVQYAKDVLLGKLFLPQYGDQSFYGTKLLDSIYKSNDNTKSLILTSIEDISNDAQVARKNESQLRIIAEQEKIPLWFSILKESTKKVIPDQEHTTIAHTVNPIFKVA